MAEIIKFQIPNKGEVQDIGYVPYDNEDEYKYVQPSETEMDPEAIKKIKAFQTKLALSGLTKFRTEKKAA